MKAIVVYDEDNHVCNVIGPVEDDKAEATAANIAEAIRDKCNKEDPGQWTIDAEVNDGSAAVFVENRNDSNRVWTIATHDLEPPGNWRPDLTKLNADDIVAILRDSGYNGLNGTNARYQGVTQSGSHHYKVEFSSEYDDSDKPEDGDVYVWRAKHTGILLADW